MMRSPLPCREASHHCVMLRDSPSGGRLSGRTVRRASGTYLGLRGKTRFYKVKACPKEAECDAEVASYALRDIEQYRNFCDRPSNQRPQLEEVEGDIAEHLTTVYLSRCERGRKCLYEGSTPPGGFPNTYNGATRCTSELTLFKNGDVHCWDRAYDDDGNQVWGTKGGPYEFKPRSSSAAASLPAQVREDSMASAYQPLLLHFHALCDRFQRELLDPVVAANISRKDEGVD
eukprot:SM000095S25024  [mRNA]  locus=s95:532479:538278:- [translate_table: standard]